MRLRALFAIFSIAVTAGAAHADTYTLLGTNAESVALGGAMTAGPMGSSGVFYNPAALNMKHKQESETTYFWLKPSLYIERNKDERLEKYLKSPGSGEDAKKILNVVNFKRRVNDIQENRAERVPLIRGFNIGLVTPLAEEREESKASFGLGLYIPQGPIMRQRINAPETPYFVEFDDRTQRIVIDAGIGVDITDDIHVGGGASFLVDIPVDMDVYVPINFNVVDLVTNGQENLDISVTPLAQVEVTPVIAPNAGVLWDVTDWISFGATYRDEVKAEVEANAALVAETGTGRSTAVPMRLKSSAAFTPRQVALGTKIKPTEKLTLYGDATWSQWSHYRPPVAEFRVSNMKQLVSELLAGSGIADLGLLGSTIDFAGQPFAIPTTDQILDIVPDFVDVKYEFKGFRNTWTPRLGARYEINEELTAMAGYFYRPTIEDPLGFRVVRTVNLGGKVTRTKLNQNTLDNDQHGVSGGVAYKYKNYRLTVTGVYVKLIEKEIDKTADLSIVYRDESPQPGLQTTAYGYPGYKYGGSVVGGLVQAGIAF